MPSLFLIGSSSLSLRRIIYGMSSRYTISFEIRYFACLIASRSFFCSFGMLLYSLINFLAALTLGIWLRAFLLVLTFRRGGATGALSAGAATGAARGAGAEATGAGAADLPNKLFLSLCVILLLFFCIAAGTAAAAGAATGAAAFRLPLPTIFDCLGAGAAIFVFLRLN